MLEATIKDGVQGSVRSTVAPVMLTPAAVEKMIAKRQAVQLAKFRTTCTDCLPNY
jgi:hypothetical protein